MKTYYLTAFAPSGKTLLNQTFEAETEEQAKKTGQAKLTEAGYSDHTHRCVSPNAELILFHR